MKSKGKIFMLDDDELILTMLSKVLKRDGYDIYSESKTDNIVSKIKSWSPDVVLLDIRLPDRSGIEILEDIKKSDIETQVIMLTADDTAETAVKAMKLGAVDYLTKPFNKEEVKIVIDDVIEKGRLKQEVAFLRKAYAQLIEKDFIGESRVSHDLMAKVVKMAKAHVSTVLITGESGTGKEVLSRMIHHLMHESIGNKYMPYISINCAAMPEALLESELFGYEKGSFTDARTEKKGLFEAARGGSVLLDEIGDMKPNLQSKLLRVIEERTIRRIGSKHEIPIDITVIATTNRNLQQAVEKNEFRKDLFFRLSTFYLHIPPLRERREDIPALLKYFLSYFIKKYNSKAIGLSPEAEKLLISYNWPGNVRELKNLVERFVVMETSDLILPENLPRWLLDEATPFTLKESGSARFTLPEGGVSLEDLERDLIMQALSKAGNNKTIAAKLLNISYDTLRYQIKKFGLQV